MNDDYIKNPDSLSQYHTQTRLVHGGYTRSQYHETSEAIYATSGYVYHSAEEAEKAFSQENRYVYSRYANPTTRTLEVRMAALEGAEECLATSSGMAAVFASLACFLNKNSRLVASRELFGSCHYIITQILPQWGVQCELVKGSDLSQWQQALQKPVDAVFIESPSNPCLDIIPINEVAKLTKQAGGILIVDNVFATPLYQKPLQLGADVVVYSATKHIDGQGRSLAGLILSSQDFIKNKLTPFIRHTGPSLSPFNSWLLLKGMETLHLRISKMNDNCNKIVQFLDSHPLIEKVYYPYLTSHDNYLVAKQQMTQGSTLTSFVVKGGKSEVFQFLNKLRLIKISNNLGDAKSLITHPSTTTHQRLTTNEKLQINITDNLVRLSVGLEDPQDLIDDLQQALSF